LYIHQHNGNFTNIHRDRFINIQYTLKVKTSKIIDRQARKDQREGHKINVAISGSEKNFKKKL